MLNQTATAPPKKRRRSKSQPPAFGELCEYITKEFGGPQQLAKVFKQAYDCCKDGSNAQVTLAMKICDLILRNTQISGDRTDLEEVTDEDLTRMLKELGK